MNLAGYRNVWKDDATCNIDKKDKWWIHDGWRYRIKQYFVMLLTGFSWKLYIELSIFSKYNYAVIIACILQN